MLFFWLSPQKNSNHGINESERHRTTFASSFLPSIILSHKKNQLLRKILWTFENAPVKSDPSHWQLLPLLHPPNRSESDEASSCTMGGGVQNRSHRLFLLRGMRNESIHSLPLRVSARTFFHVQFILSNFLWTLHPQNVKMPPTPCSQLCGF